MQQSLCARLMLMVSLGLCSTSLYALPGQLDLSFGDDGIKITDFFDRTDVSRNLNIADDGTILIGGSATKNSSADHFALARYDSEGGLDRSFGEGGKLATNKLADSTYLYGGIGGSGLQQDGKIVACGRYGQGIVVIRYHEDGSIDKSFGEDGITKLPDASVPNTPLALTIDQDDKIVVVASQRHSGAIESTFGVFRFNANGGLDETFGEHGTVSTTITGGNDVPRAVKVDKDGKVVAGGFSGYGKFVVVRYNHDGSIDTEFGNDGVATIYFNDHGNDSLNALALQEDGKIVVGGLVQVGSFGGMRMIDFGIARLTSDGHLDLSFNITGKQITHFVRPAASALWALTIQDDGKIIAVGDSFHVKGLGIARYNTDGSLDESFGENGKQMLPIGRTCHWEAVGLQPDGKIVTSGYVWNGKHYDMAVARFDAN